MQKSFFYFSFTSANADLKQSIVKVQVLCALAFFFKSQSSLILLLPHSMRG